MKNVSNDTLAPPLPRPTQGCIVFVVLYRGISDFLKSTNEEHGRLDITAKRA